MKIVSRGEVAERLQCMSDWGLMYFAVNMRGKDKVGMADFALLKVLGTGGKCLTGYM